MKLLLANQEYYAEYAERALAKFQAIGSQNAAEAYQEMSARDFGEYAVVGSDAVIHVAGPLTYKYDFWSFLFGGTSYQGLQAQLNSAMGNTNIDRVIMVFDTPGGEITGLSELSKSIASTSKSVTAVVDPCCASAGLWLAASCDKIVSIPSGETGSLGVQCVAKSYAKYFADAGIDISIFRASISPDKNLAHPFEERSEKATEYLQSRVDRAGEKFVSWVAKGRNVSESVVLEKFGQGRMLEAEDAVEVGLIDSIGTLESVLSEAKNTNKKSPRRSAKTSRRPIY